MAELQDNCSQAGRLALPDGATSKPAYGLVMSPNLARSNLSTSTLEYNLAMNEDATYICDSCGEEIVVPIDRSAGSTQRYIEDCPVCCNPNIIHVEFDELGDVRVWGEAEQDHGS